MWCFSLLVLFVSIASKLLSSIRLHISAMYWLSVGLSGACSGAPCFRTLAKGVIEVLDALFATFGEQWVQIEDSGVSVEIVHVAVNLCRYSLEWSMSCVSVFTEQLAPRRREVLLALLTLCHRAPSLFYEVFRPGIIPQTGFGPLLLIWGSGESLFIHFKIGQNQPILQILSWISRFSTCSSTSQITRWLCVLMG